MGDQADAALGIVDPPHGQIVVDATNAAALEELGRPDAHPSHELVHRLAAGEPVPLLDRDTLAQRLVRLHRALRRLAVPVGVADLLEPRLDHFGERRAGSSTGAAVCRALVSGDT